ncbi:hypothetical protein [Kribbella sp. NPDC048928]|uniref:hypothetical protein n=1 Tax=Kribbella sp. NPDC048928 TaxID=3364111 RepID=UPI00371140A6
MSVDTSTTSAPPTKHLQVVLLVLAVTVIAFAAIVVLALTGHAAAAVLIGPVWATSCGVLGFRKARTA